MKQEKIQLLVADAIALDRKITEFEEDLKGLKTLLVQVAESYPEEQTETEGGGRAWIAEDAVGNIARVNFPAPALKSKVDGTGKTIEKIRDVAGKWFPDLFDQAPAYKPKPEFRSFAEKFLERATARKLIKLCSTESAPRVSFETKEKQE
jgi:hypothetical protein